jgi:uncharacterized protein (DUF2141 family)
MIARARALLTLIACVSAAFVGAAPSLRAVGQELRPAAQGQLPTRDATLRPATGTAVLAGQVISAADARPLRRVSITISAGELRGSRSSLTDDSGAFVFSDLPAGRFSVSASKPAYLTAQYNPAGRGPATPVTLTAGQRTTITVKLSRGAVLTGTVLDSSGRPQANVRVRVMRFVNMNGQRSLSGAGGSGGQTDDRGAYRIYGLPPGDYYVAATPAQNGQDVRPITEADIRWAKQRLQRSAAPGVATTPMAAPAAPPPAPAQPVGYASVFYPGTVDPASATMLTLRAGDERTGIDFSLQLVPTARIEGIVLDPFGRPSTNPPPQMRLIPSGPMAGQPPDSVTSSFRMTADGKFQFMSVPPGQYILAASVTSRPQAPGVPPLPPPPPMPPGGVTMVAAPTVQVGRGSIEVRPEGERPPPPISLWALMDLDVNGRDLSNLTLNLRPGLAVSGRVTFESTTSPPPPDLTKVRLSLSMFGASNFSLPVPSSTVSADGSFKFTGAPPGKYRVSGSAPGVPNQGSPWTLKSVIVNGRDALDFPFEIGGDDVAGVIATYSDRTAEISGTLFDGAGKPTMDYSVVVFSAERAFWTPGSRRVRNTRPSPDGRFRATPLPAGEYYMIAIADVSQLDLADPAVLEQLAGVAFKIAVGDGEKKVQDLKLAGGT